MTGTAMTEEGEFMEIYGLDVISIPTNLPVCREDYDDEIYRTTEEKHAAILETVRECHSRGQPMLVGTASIEKSELFSRLLKKAKIKHNVLNARYHEQEAKIIAQAGSPGAVTIATNMAGRGTDIQLGEIWICVCARRCFLWRAKKRAAKRQSGLSRRLKRPARA